MNELALFAGYGGGILGGKLLGWRTVCAVENNPYAAAILAARQNDKTLEPFPIWDDVRTFDGTGWRGRVDIISGGFPCQDISVAGKQTGLAGDRSGLWSEFARIIGEVGPEFVLVENSPNLLTVNDGRDFGRVLSDLASLGYDAAWGVLGADDAIWHNSDPCADHERKRIWLLAALPDPDCPRQLQPQGIIENVGGRTGDIRPEIPDAGVKRRFARRNDDGGNDGTVSPASRQLYGTNLSEVSDAVRDGSATGSSNQTRWNEGNAGIAVHRRPSFSNPALLHAQGLVPRPWKVESWRSDWWQVEPGLGRVADGCPDRVGRLEALGNAQLPFVAALAFATLYNRLRNQPQP